MKVTKKLIEKIAMAEEKGYTHISVVASNHFSSVYRHYISFSEIRENFGKQINNGRYHGKLHAPENSKTIQYSQIFSSI